MSVNLVKDLENLDEAAVLEGVRSLIEQAVEPMEIILQLQSGMAGVGKKFEEQEYYLAELIYSSEIFKKAAAVINNLFISVETKNLGTLVLGTVLEDIHDIGKNLVTILMSCNGFKVYDLGVNVPPQKFVEAISEYKPQFVGLSCLLTSSFDSMKIIITEIETAGLRNGLKILVGGAPVNESVRAYVGADFYGETAQRAVQYCKLGGELYR